MDAQVKSESRSDSVCWWILGAIGAGTFMTALNNSVVNTILPVIQADFHADVAAIGWVVVLYLLVVSGLLLSFGRLGDLYGYKRVTLTGFTVFVLGSALCGVSTSAISLVIFRAVQGLGAAMVMANSPAILTRNFPPQQRGQVLGLQGTMTYLGLTVGPSLGGWLASYASWRSVFFLNVPVGLLAFLISLKFIPSDEAGRQAEPFDVTGAVAFIGGLIALLLGLNQGHAWGWGSAKLIAVLGFALVTLLIFVSLEKRSNHPMLDLHLFSSRQFTSAVVSAMFNYIALYIILYLMPYYLIQGRGMDTASAGLLLTAQPLVMAIAAPLSGTLSDRIGTRLPASAGMAIMAAGLLMLSQLGSLSTPLAIALGLAVTGLGTGVFVSPNNSALMGSAPGNRQGIAAGMLATARNVGMVLGVGIASAILASLSTSGNSAGLFSAVQTGFITATGCALLSSLVAALRGWPANES